MEEPRRLGGRYELGSVLGRGGMAEVYLAQDTRLGRTVAVKTLRVDLARDPSFQARFRREAQSAASLNHPAIVAVYDTGEDYVDNVSIPYIVMEYVDGSTLRELLHSGRKLLPERTLEMTVGILQALEYSHRAQIVHRDIKPANVMLTRTGQVKVMDFGIARAMGDSGMTMTQTAAVIGTAQYLSPEQAKGEQVDARSDLYSTGCLLYELLTVRPPFIGDSPVAVAYQHVREEPQPPSNFDPEITPEMDAIVLKALVKDPDYRYQSADEMRADIEACLDGRPVAATAALGAVGYGGYDTYGGNDQPTTALRQTGQGGQTAMMPPVAGGGDGYGNQNGNGGYDEPQGRRRQQPKKSNTSTILLVLAGILVLVGAVLIGNAVFNNNKPQEKAVPKLIGKELADAELSAKNVDMVLKTTSKPCDDMDKGKICSQNPAAGTNLPKGGSINVVVSTGAPKVEVPDVMEQTEKRATQRLTKEGFTPKVKQEESEKPEGTVIDQNPKGGEQAEKNSDVTIVIAKKKTTKLPDLKGQTYEAAEATLKSLGFTSITKAEQESDQQPNTVIKQTPDAGTKALPDTGITLIVAKPKEGQPPPGGDTVQIPGGFTGKTVGEVRGPLEGMGLRVVVPDGAPDDAKVMGTNPPAGSTVAKDSEVTLVIIPGTGGHGGGGGGIFD
ncbi:putative serine/threonine-protein kinase [Streptomyces spiroverticillatus]|uniref:non-specific serine/threonine protein kinase n=1 Tax=Streptomyces finlayi TaxID=67296 RepID=A0A918WU49_9ACTN|nr:Stk1 family PASTA domain-containing Ser/Thr kinase [Streptomyces finlayi]GGZ99032.1 putative serine/threonine-protein kinase [Streptomyces spiroverticillatus]GHC83830.1 putative serine/threonine-protein kinase [Streptomyces finlayi]